MGRRANGEGSVYQRRSDNRWVGTLTLPDGRRKSVYAPTQRLVRQRMRELQRDVDEGLPLAAHGGVTVEAYLESWLTQTLPARVLAGRLKPSTLDSYDDQIRRHVVPELGRLRLTKLTPTEIRTWLGHKQQQIEPRGRPLSPRSVAYLHAILRAALADAVRDELVTRNVAALVEAPRVRRAPVQPLTAAEATAILQASQADRLRLVWLLLLSLGLRRGEALALRWDDLDLRTGTVSISRSLQRLRGPADPQTGRRRGRLVETEPKTAESAATLALPTTLVAGLRAHRRAQGAIRAEGRPWVDDGLVFTTAHGTPLEPRNVNRAWETLCDRAGVRKVRLHDLRHSAATFLLLQGVDMKVVQATLRHSRLATTADLYTHVLAEVQRSAADRMDDLLRDLGRSR